ncbi:MAG TPA: hypothetical protein VMT57_06040 [Candidatus Thermoplasmatota archaeon]|nr:hypothetical protein [Candidatus Thermoplasmatota archaeon]
MLKKFITISIILLLTLVLIPVISISCEAKNNIVFINGHDCNGFTAGDVLFPHRLGLLFPTLFFIKSNQSGNAIILFYKGNSTLVIKNGIPQRIMYPSKIKIGLTEPKTFGIIKFFFYNILTNDQGIGTRVFAVCDSLEIDPIS